MSSADADPPVEPAPAAHRPILDWLGLVLGTALPVRPVAYAASGFGLTMLKYAVETAVVWLYTKSFLTPWQFLDPRGSTWEQLLLPARGLPGAAWLPLALFLWTLPFLWIAVTMSVRRAADAGYSPWLGLLVLVPLLNLVIMLWLCFQPSDAATTWSPESREAIAAEQWPLHPDQPLTPWSPARLDMSRSERSKTAVLAIGFSQLIGGLMIFCSVYVVSSYGASLFLGTPLLMGAAAGYLYNRRHSQGYGSSLFVGLGSVFFAEVALLLFALEGAVCLVMAAPLLLPLGLMGGLIGKAIADATRRSGTELMAAILVLPLLAGVEALLVHPSERVVTSSVEIDAPPDVVWNNVVVFPELTEPPAWYFACGIACPQRARIVGRGVGATRFCEFTTGTFVEPITKWEPPRHLAFDVAQQPEPMFELTPYRNVHPPHLEYSLKSTRGEFRLIALPGGRTRLEGRTWYRLEMLPQWYWTVWSDGLIHRIHERVLTHIKRLAEHDADGGQLAAQPRH